MSAKKKREKPGYGVDKRGWRPRPLPRKKPVDDAKREKRALRIRLTFTVFVILCITMSVNGGVVVLLKKTGLSDLMGDSAILDFFFAAVSSVAVGMLATPLMLSLPIKPMTRLIHGMKRLAAGHYEERVDLGHIGVMQDLTVTFNNLAGELQNTELLRSDFVNNFSHEFKTPMVSIHGFAQLLQVEDLPPAQRQQYVDIIVTESSRLVSMATNILLLSKVEKQSILTQETVFNLSEQVRKAILLLEKNWTEKDLDIKASFGEYRVEGNADLLEQVWLNLLHNAIKFAPVGGWIQVKVFPHMDETTKERYLAVSVTNNGPMIPPERQQRVFEKFYQGDEAHASQGAGVGLSVVKCIVELHKGQVMLDSRPEQTTFTVVLPWRESTPAERE